MSHQEALLEVSPSDLPSSSSPVSPSPSPSIIRRLFWYSLSGFFVALIFGLGILAGVGIEKHRSLNDVVTVNSNAPTAPSSVITRSVPPSSVVSAPVSSRSAEPNPPTWPSSVFVFDPSTPSITQSIVDEVYAELGGQTPSCNGQFSSSRVAFLFKSGTHSVSVSIGYYTTLAGTGLHPSDTTIENVESENGSSDYTIGALNNFWRSAENFQINPTKTINSIPNSMLWAVSQASPLRNAIINGNLQLYQYQSGCCAGYASGGFMANTKVTGTVYSGSQQQWINRNVNAGSWSGGVWNTVFVGSGGAVPQEHCGNQNGSPYTVIDKTPIIAEKPFIHIDNNGKYFLVVPPTYYNSSDTQFDMTSATIIDFSSVYVAVPNDTADYLSEKISNGLHIILTPGIYNFTSSLIISKSGTVILGLGMATLSCEGGVPCIIVKDNIDDIRIAGIILQASIIHSSSLLQWGTSVSSHNNNLKPSFIHDVFARVGGPNDSTKSSVSTDIMIQINSANVVIGNTWLWRADHDIAGLVKNRANPVQNALQINGDYATVYGLAGEHTLGDIIQWNGDYGSTYFFQSEFPYDVNTEYQDNGYVAYRVNKNIQHHHAYGVGAYSFFRDYIVTVSEGFSSPIGNDIVFKNPFIVHLTGNGGIKSILNLNGSAVLNGCSACQSYLC